MNNKVPLTDIIATIREWELQASSAHNDGWTIQGYKENLQMLKQYLENKKQPQLIT